MYVLTTIQVLILTLGVGLLTSVFLPIIRKYSIQFGFVAVPENRSSHKKITPNFGGVAFYMLLIASILYLYKLESTSTLAVLVAAFSAIFYTGIKDDVRDSSPRAKALGQCIAVALLLSVPEFRIESLHGFLGIGQLPLFIGVPLSLFLYISLINAYNLIDGIDGLAAIIGMVASASFAFLFYQMAIPFYFGLSIAMCSILLAFLGFNFSERKKIFMGDTGSLLVGLFLGMLAMKLLSVSAEAATLTGISLTQLPLLLLTVLIVPAFDVCRVTFIRYWQKQPFFTADRNHMHHVLIDSGRSHKKAAITLGLLNSAIVGLMYGTLQTYGLVAAGVVLLALIVWGSLSLFVINKKISSKRMKVKVRHMLFKMVYLKRANAPEKQLRFNKKLKLVRIFFF